MSFWIAPIVLSAFWLAIYAAHNIRCSSGSLLPTSFLTRRYLWNASAIKVMLTNLHLQIQSIAWNPRHESLANSIAKRKNVHIKTSLTYFYNVGCAAGLLGMAGALGVLVWTCTQQGFWLVDKQDGSEPPSNMRLNLRKRELEPGTSLYGSHTHFLKPIVSSDDLQSVHCDIVTRSKGSERGLGI
jgi:hypothetical protein